VTKRMFDVCVAVVSTLLLAPVFIAVAVTIRLSSPGPALYRSARLGRHGRTFEMLKFRTMTVGAPDLRNPDGSTFSGEADPRITPLGRWLRRTSLDELPQLWNVLRGDMSLVGPRPDLPDQIRYYAPADHRRLTVRPGLTGLAQTAGRNALSWEQRRALDLQYVDSRSFRGDLLILARTLPGVLSGRGVYMNPSSPQKPEGRSER
jgi:lipopolysaccharide/colanic/teichoic acid biosynthesis glycosyltransferase